MNFLGSMDNTSGMCVAWSASGIKTWQDMFDKEFLVGSSGAGSQMETLPLMVNKLFGTKIKVISGYRGGNEVFLAMERGEVHGRCGSMVASITSTRPDWFPQKKVTVPFQIALERDPDFPDAPALGEFAKDARTRQILELVVAHMRMDKPVLLPPGVPPERVGSAQARVPGRGHRSRIRRGSTAAAGPDGAGHLEPGAPDSRRGLRDARRRRESRQRGAEHHRRRGATECCRLCSPCSARGMPQGARRAAIRSAEDEIPTPARCRTPG